MLILAFSKLSGFVSIGLFCCESYSLTPTDLRDSSNTLEESIHGWYNKFQVRQQYGHTYDNQGQLLSATGDTTYTYTYDGAGNILTANGHTYTYGDATWKDLLTAFDGNSISYDAIGNPTSYYNGTRWNFTWANGRSLATASDGTNSLSFAYDANGLRTSKTVNGTTYRYYYAGGKLMRMTWSANTIDFFYDANGTPYAMKYNGTVYYYVTSLQGDVMRIVNASGAVIASYDYDPYGKVISATGTLANINPLRYRGYVYDQETGFYYLQSRYYDPAVGRFLNADSYATTGQGIIGHNMFAYCGNNPANFSDKTGYAAIGQEAVKVGLGVLISSLDGPSPILDIISVLLLTAVFAGTRPNHAENRTLPPISVDSIDWESGDKNHILKGTGRKHVPGWKRFGKDPDGNNGWEMILPILKEVVEHADEFKEKVARGGGTVIEYSKTYVEEGVRVVVKIWISADGTRQQLSDGIPYIIK